MRQLRSEVEIKASPEKVWRVLTDFKSFPTWNPFIREAQGKLVPLSQLKIRLMIGRRLVTFYAYVTVVDPPRELRWIARQRLAGIFDVDRRFELERVGRSQVRLVQSERATGLLAPVLVPILRRRIQQGYRALESALQDRVQHVH